LVNSLHIKIFLSVKYFSIYEELFLNFFAEIKKKIMKKLSIKDVVSEIKKNKDISKKEIYNFCLQLKK